MLERVIRGVDWRAAGGVLLAAVLVIALWDTWVVYPLKVLVVLFHELSHGLAAIATGGAIERIEIVAEQGGVCYTRGGSRFLTLSAGYVGSMIAGGVILTAAARTRLDRGISVALGLMLLGATVLWIRPVFGFGFIFGGVAGMAFVGMGALLPESVNDFVLRLVGLTSCLYAIPDIKSDILDRPELRSDAVMLGEVTHLPARLWGVIWILVAVVVGIGFLLLACRKGADAGGGAVEAR